MPDGLMPAEIRHPDQSRHEESNPDDVFTKHAHYHYAMKAWTTPESNRAYTQFIRLVPTTGWRVVGAPQEIRTLINPGLNRTRLPLRQKGGKSGGNRTHVVPF